MIASSLAGIICVSRPSLSVCDAQLAFPEHSRHAIVYAYETLARILSVLHVRCPMLIFIFVLLDVYRGENKCYYCSYTDSGEIQDCYSALRYRHGQGDHTLYSERRWQCSLGSRPQGTGETGWSVSYTHIASCQSRYQSPQKVVQNEPRLRKWRRGRSF